MTPEPVIPFFNGYFRELEEKRWPGVILHGWESLPETIGSDVDYLVGGVTRAELLAFLADYCRRKGWQLAQVMEHEPDALYCVCLMAGPPWAAVKLDVAWDYRRKGRLLLPGCGLLAGRRVPSGKSFHVPAAAAEFAYVLAKGLAKSKGAGPVIQRLTTLWQEDAAGCAAALQRHFGVSAADPAAGFPAAVVAAILRPDNRDFDRWRSRRWGFSQLRWLARRLRRPYGLTVAVGRAVDPARVGEILLAAFRRFQVLGADPGFWRRRVIEYRSSLLVGGPPLAGKPGVLDLSGECSVDACVAAVLAHLRRRLEPGDPGQP
jgi:hypothetical protein